MRLTRSFALLGCAMAASTALAQTFVNSTVVGAMRYSLYKDGGTWQEDRIWTATHLPGGRLASIRNVGTNRAVSGLLVQADIARAWIGGAQLDQTSGGPTDGWSWDDGSPWGGYQAWRAGEPNDAFGRYSEQYLEILSYEQWNDNTGVAFGARAFVTQQPVPEPATLVALGVGAAGLVRRRRT